MSSQHSLVVDATGSVAIKISEKEIFYFAFLSFDRSLKTEPVPHIEILTEKATFNTLKFTLSTFLEDEMRRYNYTTHSVPVLCTTDCSWPIIKCLISAFNNETLEEYIFRSFQIVSGNATIDTLPVKSQKTFVHISLCHSMKSYAKKIDKLIKTDKKFLKYYMSVIANTGGLSDVFLAIKHLFYILLSPYSYQCVDSKIFFEEKIECIEQYKDECLVELSGNTFENSDGMFETSDNLDLPIKEVTYLQQSKRSIYYQKSKSLFKDISTSRP